MIVTACSYANYCKNNNNQQNLRKINNAHADKVSFGGNNLTKARRTELAAQLSEKMKNRPETSQKLYQYAIDFLNNKIDNTAYISNIYKLVKDMKRSDWNDFNKAEKWFAGTYGLMFDTCNPDSEDIGNSTILNLLNYLFIDDSAI